MTLFFCRLFHTPVKVFGALLPVALALTACGSVPRDSAEACDFKGQSGICVQFGADAPRLDPRALEAAYIQAKADVARRYHLDLADLPGPVVHVASRATFAGLHPTTSRLDGDTGGDHGWTDFRSGQITLTGKAVMKHEAFHYILWRAEYPNQLNAAHDHPAFDEYRDGNWLPRRATASASADPTVASSRQP